MFKMFIYIAIYFCAAFLPVYCQTGQNAKDLSDYLFGKNYNKKVRPRLNQTESIDVKVELTLLSIDGLSEASETFQSTGYLGITWKDEFLTWNKKEFGGLDFYRWPQVDVWKPDIVLLNSYQDFKIMGDDSLLVEVNADGMIVWYPYQVFQSICSVDVRYFPFDSQTCELRFGAWSYYIWEVNAQINGTGINLDSCRSKPDWDVQPLHYGSEEVERTTIVTFSLKLTRKPLYVLLTIFMPTVLLSILNIFVFVLPCESGEKAGYAITVFLAFAVLLTIVSPTLPRSSDTVAIFSVFLIILIVQSTLITAISLILIRCYSFEDKAPVPKILQWCLQIITCSVCQVKQKVRPVEYRIFVLTDHVTEMFEFEKNKKEDDKIGGKGKQKAGIELTWKEAVEKLDRICLIFFLFTFLVSLGVCTYFAAFHG